MKYRCIKLVDNFHKTKKIYSSAQEIADAGIMSKAAVYKGIRTKKPIYGVIDVIPLRHIKFIPVEESALEIYKK